MNDDQWHFPCNYNGVTLNYLNYAGYTLCVKDSALILLSEIPTGFFRGRLIIVGTAHVSVHDSISHVQYPTKHETKLDPPTKVLNIAVSLLL